MVMKNQKNEFKIIGGVIAFALLILIVFNYFNKLDQEKVESTSIVFSNFPQNQIIDSTSFVLKGKISDTSVKLNAKLGKMLSYSNGEFEILLENPTESDTYLELILSIGSATKIIHKQYGVRFNIATKKYLEELHALELKTQREQEMLEYLSNVKLYGKKAARIKKSHPNWSWDDCSSLSQNKIWIGMDIQMLIFLRGRDFNRNISNYGNGNQYQYCWSDYDISCFYDNNDDGKIDSYN